MMHLEVGGQGSAAHQPNLVAGNLDDVVGKSPIRDLFDHTSVPRRILPGATICLHGEPADTVYQITAGVVRCCLINTEGQRQIVRFAIAGQFLGFAAIDSWHFTAEALSHVRLRSISRDTLETALVEDRELQREVRRLVTDELKHREQQLIMMAYMPACQRLLCFLEAFAGATVTVGGYTVLPMTRQDIGDYLGLSLETVSRAFTKLKRDQVIEMEGSDHYRFIDGASSGTLAA
ncbi:MAG: cyclic nucleotide-binding domain-containing protein [Geminicoccaceae bacterium]